MNSAAEQAVVRLLSSPRSSVGEATDAELLRRFAKGRDEAAFTELVSRHGPLVLSVCRRVLRDGHAAEDAFQATFLLLARKAARLGRLGSLAGWLYTVARRSAGQVRRSEERRRRRETRAGHPATTSAADDIAWREVRELLDTELARLPEQQRTPLVLCYLKGLSQAEAARQLGWSEPMLRGRLERGRTTLRRRLARHGLPLAALLLPIPAAPVPAALQTATLGAVRAGLALASRRSATAALLCIAVSLGLAVAAATRPAAPPSPPQARGTPARAGVDLLGDPLPPHALRRLGTLRHRHLWVWFAPKQLLPDGKTTLTATRAEVRWVDMGTGRLSRTWPLPKGFSASGFSSDGRLALLFDDRTYRLWDLAARKELRLLKRKGRYSTPSETFFSPDNKVVAVLCGTILRPGLVRVFDVATGEELWQEGMAGGNDEGLRPLGFVDRGKSLAALVGPGNRFTLRDRDTGRESRSFATMPQTKMRSCFLAPDGKTVFMGTAARFVSAWDVGSGKELPVLGGHEGDASVVTVSRDSKTVLTGGYGSSLFVWDWPSGKLRRRIEQVRPGSQAMTVSADGKRAEVILLGEMAQRFIDLETGKELPPPTEGHRGPALCVAVTKTGKVLSAGSDGTLRAWDLRSGRHLGQQAFDPLPFNGMVLVPGPANRRAAALDTHNGTIRLLDWSTGRAAQTIKTGAILHTAAFSPDDRLLAASGFYSRPGGFLHFVEIWDARGRSVWRKEGFGAHVLTFSADRRTLAGFNSFDGKAIRLWETATGAVRGELPGRNVCALAFAPDGRTLAGGDPKGITLWDVAGRKVRGRIEATTTNARLLCFSPDGRWLSRADGREVHLFDVRRGSKVGCFTGHDEAVQGLAFAPDSRTLVSASADSTLLVWDVAGAAQ
jgi:RNA polymerase sigma factor (sigma-70 family)